MKHKFLEDLGIDINDDTKELLQQFDLNGFMDQISDNRLTEVKEKVEDKVEICYSTESLKIVIPEARNYYDVLREKLKWGENLC